MKHKFYVKDCPEWNVPHYWIKEKVNLQYYMDNMKPVNTDKKFLSFKHSGIDLKKVQESCESAFEKFGFYGFLNIYGQEMFRDPTYGGLSLVYNPNYKFKDQVETNAQTLGYPRNNMNLNFILENLDLWKKVMIAELDKDIWRKSTKYGTHVAFKFLLKNNVINEDEYRSLRKKYPNEKKKVKHVLKDTYQDSWGFNTPTDVMNHEYLAEVTKLFKRSFIRSRLAKLQQLDNEEIRKNVNEYMWHRDDSIFMEARINLSVTSPQDAFGMEIEGAGRYYLQPGNWYSWDTGITHRPFADKPNLHRTNLVYAVSPWFDYIKEEQAWVSNEFFGEKHPVDMFIDGDIVEGLEFID